MIDGTQLLGIMNSENTIFSVTNRDTWLELLEAGLVLDHDSIIWNHPLGYEVLITRDF